MFSKRFVFRLFAISVIVLFLLASFPKSVFLQSEDIVKAPQTVFSNASPITINTAPTTTAPIAASLYPSTINVSGMTGTITNVAVTLRGLTHVRVSNMDFLLVSPSGAKFVFLSDPNNTDVFTINDNVYTFVDSASSTIPNFSPFTPGNYKPTNNDTSDTFPLPAPAAPYNFPPSATFASTFNGADPNGTWSLYAVDDALGGAGSVNSGWSLTITTTGSPQQTFSNSNYIGLDDTVTRATPYGSTIGVSGLTGVISNLRVTLTGLSHQLPQDVDVLLVSPNGRGLILLSDAGSSAITDVNLTFDDSASGGVNQVSVVSGTYKPTNYSSGGNENFDVFQSPAPLRPYIESSSPQLSNFNGFSPNGEWKLFVTDDAQGSSGMISGGWSLDITTTPLQQPTVGCAAPSFAVATNTSVGINPTNLAIGDFNNDNKEDLVVTNQVSNDVSILLGNGNGTFAPQTLLTAGSSPYDVIVGRFNADNNDDLAVVNSGSNNVSILLGNGNGTFSAPTNFFVGASPISIAVSDFNNDSKQDLAVANFGGFFAGAVSILLGNGNGGFTATSNIRTRTQPSFVTTGSFNGDANTDLVVTNFGADSVSIFFGNGNGTFQLSQNLSTGSGPVAVEVANLSADNFLDLAVANYNADSYTTMFGNANGIFSSGSTTPNIGSNPISLVAGNFLGGNNNQIALALSGSNHVTFSASNLFTVGISPNAIAKGDFNADGLIDLVTVNAGSNDVSVLQNSCSVAKGNLFDFNGDRKTDIAVFRPISASWFIQPLSQAATFARDTDTIVPADYDGDSLTDLAIFRPENGLWISTYSPFSNKQGSIHFLQFGLSTDIPSPADFDGDRKADIAVFRPSEGTWYIRKSTDNSLQIVQFGLNGDKPVAADYDGDGIADIAVFRPSNNVWYILRSSDNQVTFTQFGISTDKTVPNDYDGDGKADIAVYRDGVWYVLRSSDSGYLVVGFGMSSDTPIPGDYDADGKFDFAIFRPNEGNWWALKSTDGTVQVIPFGISTDTPIPSVFVR